MLRQLGVTQNPPSPGRIHARRSILDRGGSGQVPVTANPNIRDRCPDAARMELVRIPRRPFETVELIENLVDGRGRDTEVFALRSPEAVAYVGEHGEFTLEV